MMTVVQVNNINSSFTSTIHGVAIRDNEGVLLDFLETSSPQSTNAIIEETRKNYPNKTVREEYIPTTDIGLARLKAKRDV